MDPKDIKLMMAQLEVMTATLQAALGAPKAKKTKKAPVEGEVKKSNPWLDFTKRVRLVLIENGQKPGLVTQFCKALKEAKAYDDWSDDAILEQRKSWVEPAKKISEKAEKAEKAESQSRPTDVPVGEWVATKHAEIAEKTAVAEAKTKPAAKKAPAKAKEAPVEEYDAERMEPNIVKIKGKSYYVNGYGDVFDEDDFTYLGSQKGEKIIDGPAPARVVKYLAAANN